MSDLLSRLFSWMSQGVSAPVTLEIRPSDAAPANYLDRGRPRYRQTLPAVLLPHAHSRRDQECQTDDCYVNRRVMTDPVKFPIEVFDPDYVAPIRPADAPAVRSIQYGFQHPCDPERPVFRFSLNGARARASPAPKFVFRPPKPMTRSDSDSSDGADDEFE
jgi:hypothetical protein